MINRGINLISCRIFIFFFIYSFLIFYKKHGTVKRDYRVGFLSAVFTYAYTAFFWALEDSLQRYPQTVSSISTAIDR